MTSIEGASAIHTNPTKAKIFISYSRKDAAFADRLEAGLKASGFNTLIDRTEIYALEDWWKRIENLIVRADTVVFVISSDAVASPICQNEVSFAASLNKRLAPVVYRRVDDKLVPEALARLNFIFFEDEASFDASLTELAEALKTDIEWVRRHTEFGEHARRWEAAGRPGPRGLLLRSPFLEEAEQWIATRPHGAPQPTAVTQAFIAESRRAATRRRNLISASLGAGLVIALALAGVAYWQRDVAVEQRDQAVRRQSRFLASASIAATNKGDTGSGIALALEALPTSAQANDRLAEASAVQALYAAWLKNREVRAFLSMSDKEIRAFARMDQSYVLTQSATNELILVSAQSANVVQVIDEKDPIQDFVVCPSGEMLVAATSEGLRVRRWDGAKFGEAKTVARYTGRLDIDRRCSAVAVSRDGDVAVVDLSTFRSIFSIPASITGVSRVYVDTTNRRVVTVAAGLELYYWGSHGQKYDKEAAFKVWDLDSQSLLASFLDFKKEICDSALSESGTLLAAASMDGTAILFDFAANQVRRRFSPGHSVMAIAINERQDAIVLGFDNTVSIYGLSADSQLRASYRNDAPITSIAAASSFPLIASTSDDKKIVLYDVGNKQQIALVGHAATPTSIAFSSLDRMLISAGKDKSLRLWNIGTIKVARYFGRHAQGAQQPLLLPDGNRFATSDRGGNAVHGAVALWDANTGAILAQIDLAGKDVHAGAVSPDGAYLAYLDSARTVYLLSTDNLKLVKKSDVEASSPNEIHFLKNGSTLVTSSLYGSTTNWQLWSVPDLTLLRQSTTETGKSAFLLAAEQLARLGPNGVVELYDPTTEHVIASIDAKLPHEISSVIALNDGKFIAAYSYDGGTALIEVAKRSVLKLPSDISSEDIRAIDPTGRSLIWVHDNLCKVFDIPTFKLRYQFEGPVDELRAANPERATSDGSYFQLFNNVLVQIAFSSDSRQFAVSSSTGGVQLRDLETGKLFAELKAGNEPAGGLAFLPNGKQLLTASHDGGVRAFTYFNRLQDLLSETRSSAPRCLTTRQREEAFLTEDQASWCKDRWPNGAFGSVAKSP